MTSQTYIGTDKIAVRILLEQARAYGLKHIVFSPGSRNAPFVIAFDEHPDFKCTVISDERSAAFFALGMAQELNEPVAICCTSGSALLNYYPAVAEAYYQNIPLIILSADRPKEWTDQGDGQTINQHEVYRNHIRFQQSFDEISDNPDSKWFTSREIGKGFSIACGKWQGPVHFNFHFREPLYRQLEVQYDIVKPLFHFDGGKFADETALHEVLSVWNSSKKRMILCGQMNPDKILLENLKLLAQDPSVIILVENTSNLVDQSFVHCIDRTLNAFDNELADFRPEILVTLGGAVVSKRIKSFLRKSDLKAHIKVGYDFPFMDTYQHLSHSLEVECASFIALLGKYNIPSQTNFGSKWKQLDFMNQDKAQQILEKLPYSDLTVFHAVLDFIPEDTHLHLANSSVIRYAQLFDPVKSFVYRSNRGTSGIDGSLSTASGAAYANPDYLHLAITGDVSFFYDSNALWNNNLLPNLRIILINNGGGDIFNIIPGPDQTRQQKTYFVTENKYEAKHLCENFSIEYFSANSIEDLESLFAEFYEYNESGRPKLLEINTTNQNNHKILNDYFEIMK